MRTPGCQIKNQLWRRLESEHRQLRATLVDVGELAADGSFETARKRFGTFRVSQERHLVADQKLLVLCEDNRDLQKFLNRVRRNRGATILEQTERVWAPALPREGGAASPDASSAGETGRRERGSSAPFESSPISL